MSEFNAAAMKQATEDRKYEQVVESIKRSALCGDYATVFYDLDEWIVNQLKDLGFKVTELYTGQYTVRWG